MVCMRGRPKVDAEGFAQRLNAVLDSTPGVPPLSRGRAPWLGRKYKVSQPTARSWLIGNFLPERERIAEIAADFGTTYDYLVFGGSPEGNRNLIENTANGPKSQPVRDDDLRLALRLASDALGRDGYLPPVQHAELVMLVLELLGDDLPEATILSTARRWTNSTKRLDDDARGKDHPNQGAAG